jgi:quinoprotein dehydrogenase-associated probable ABC transporter substrate-binding protein
MPSRISFAICAVALLLATAAHADGAFRVCANPNNLPFSNAKGEGFENKLAELIAHDLGETISYTWTNEHEHFVKKTMGAGKCDVLMGVPAGFGEVDTTIPYYTSGYVFVSRKDRGLNISSMRDPRLRSLKIGLHVIGDDNTPPMEALARQGITQNIAGYMIYRDTQAKGHSRLIDDVAAGKVDMAAVWGPLAGYYAKRALVPLKVSLITDTGGFAPAVFKYAIALGVRKGDTRLKAQLDLIVARERFAIRNLLRAYGVPIIETPARAAG